MERTASGVPRAVTHPHPMAVTLASTAMTPPAMRQAVSTGRTRSRHGTAVPTQSQPM